MPIQKEHKEFYTVDLDRGWEVPAGYPSGIEQQILAGSLDEKKRTGFRTRHLRFHPGVYTTAPFVHEYWEEVYLVSGELIVGSDANAPPSPQCFAALRTTLCRSAAPHAAPGRWRRWRSGRRAPAAPPERPAAAAPSAGAGRWTRR